MTEIYGLVTGPPAWRQTLITTLKELGFKRHPLAPCVVLMYDDATSKHEPIFGNNPRVPSHLSGLIVIETDELLGGGISDRFHDAIAKL